MSSVRRLTSPRHLTFAVLSGLLFGGCSALTGPVTAVLPDWAAGGSDRGFERASKANPVTQVAGFWQPAEDTGPHGLPVRGFAGKILLFPADSRGDEPIAARGSVRVSLYDQTGGTDELIHQYDLPPEAWETHLAHSNLGVGYEVFLPYLRDDPRAVRCGLRIRFIPEYEDGSPGRPIFSAVETCSLGGAGLTRPQNGLRAEVAATQHGMRTETIRPVPVDRDERAIARDTGVVPASGERRANGGVQHAGGTPTDGLDPAMRARVEAALDQMKRRNAIAARGNAAASLKTDEAPPASSGRRFTLSPAGTSATTETAEPASHPLLTD